MSMLGEPPRTYSAISFPVTGPNVSPIMACPVATNKPGYRETAPTAGKPSGRQGLKPHHSDLSVAFSNFACFSATHLSTNVEW
jgi:hypothetical protein